jgi:hypothetical protein
MGGVVKQVKASKEFLLFSDSNVCREPPSRGAASEVAEVGLDG